MESTIMNIETLPLFISETFHVPKVSVEEKEGGIFIMPITEAEVSEQPKTLRYGRGCMKGKMPGAEEHDWFEPMEDFKDYM